MKSPLFDLERHQTSYVRVNQRKHASKKSRIFDQNHGLTPLEKC